MVSSARERAREADLLRFGLDEVAAVDPSPGEEESLAAEETRLGFADTLVLLGVASLSTIVPSGPAFIGTLQFAYALAIEFAGAPAAIGVAAATLVQVCILLPTALGAVAILIHRSSGVSRTRLRRAMARSGIVPV